MRRDKHAICVLETNCNKTEVTEYTGTITFKSNLQYGHIFIPNRGLTKQKTGSNPNVYLTGKPIKNSIFI